MDIKHPSNLINTRLGGVSALSDFHGVFSKMCIRDRTKAGWSTTFDFPTGFTVSDPKDNSGTWTVKMKSDGTSAEAIN